MDYLIFFRCIVLLILAINQCLKGAENSISGKNGQFSNNLS